MSETTHSSPEGSEHQTQDVSEVEKAKQRQQRIEELADINEKDFRAEQERAAEDFTAEMSEAVEGIERDEITQLRTELHEFLDTDVPESIKDLSVSDATQDKIRELVLQDHVNEILDAVYPIPEGADEKTENELLDLRWTARELLNIPDDDFEDVVERWSHYEEVEAAAKLRGDTQGNKAEVEPEAETSVESSEADNQAENTAETREVLNKADADELLQQLEKKLGIERADNEEGAIETQHPSLAELSPQERNDEIASLYSQIFESSPKQPEHQQTTEDAKTSFNKLLDNMARALALMAEKSIREEIARRTEQTEQTKNTEEPTETVERGADQTQEIQTGAGEEESEEAETPVEKARKLTIGERLKAAASALMTSGPSRLGRAWGALKNKTTGGEGAGDSDNDTETEVNPNKKRRKIIGWAVGATAVIAAGVVLVLTRDPDSAAQAKEAMQGFIPQGGGGGSMEHVSSAVDQAGNAVPAHEFSEAARTATAGEGWFNTIQESTGITNGGQMRTVLDDVGPRLVQMGEAYVDPTIGGYGISRPGEISEAALNLIRDNAISHGFINK